MVPDEGHFVLHALNNRINEASIFENSLTVGFGFRSVKVALEEYNFKKVQKMHLHSIVLLFDDLRKSLNERVNDNMRYFIGEFLLLIQIL